MKEKCISTGVVGVQADLQLVHLPLALDWSAWPALCFRCAACGALCFRCGQGHPGGNPGANLESTSHRCFLREVAFEWEVTKETIYLPLGCLQGDSGGPATRTSSACPQSRISRSLAPVQCFSLVISKHLCSNIHCLKMTEK